MIAPSTSVRPNYSTALPKNARSRHRASSFSPMTSDLEAIFHNPTGGASCRGKKRLRLAPGVGSPLHERAATLIVIAPAMRLPHWPAEQPEQQRRDQTRLGDTGAAVRRRCGLLRSINPEARRGLRALVSPRSMGRARPKASGRRRRRSVIRMRSVVAGRGGSGIVSLPRARLLAP